MSRTMTTAAKTASQDEVVRAVNLVDMDFSSGLVYWNTSPMSITWSGNEYLGVGNLGTISQVAEGADLSAKGITVEFTGVPSALVSVALGDNYQQRPINVWLAFLDVNYDLIADPVLIFNGLMDTMDVTMGETAKIVVHAESHMAAWNRPNVLRYTDAEQQHLYPGDKGLIFAQQMEEKTLIWGRA